MAYLLCDSSRRASKEVAHRLHRPFLNNFIRAFLSITPISPPEAVVVRVSLVFPLGLCISGSSACET
jgi:hypothetical protein